MKYHVIYWQDFDSRWVVWYISRPINDAHILKNQSMQAYPNTRWLVVEDTTDLSQLFNPPTF